MNLKDIPAAYVIKAAKIVKRLAYTIALIGAVTSFGTQVELIESWGIDQAYALGIAGTIDLLAICAAIALQVPGLPALDRKIVGTILTVTVGVSITANIIAGMMESAGAAAAHAWPVVAYLFAELIASRLRNFVARVMAAQADAKAAASAAQVQAPVVAQAVVQPAAPVIQVRPAAKAAIAVAAAVGKAQTTAVSVRDFKPHTACSHEKTPAARAACRKVNAI